MLRDVTLGAFLAVTIGYFYGGSVPKIIYFQKEHMFQEVRDAYFHKCEVSNTLVKDDGSSEELYSCPHVKLFLLKKYTVVQTQSKGGAR